MSGDSILLSLVDDSGLPHSQRLFPLLENTLRKFHFSLSAIDLFAVNIGPGSFTGLRVGLAAIKGLAFTVRRDVLGITALDALTYAAGRVGIPVGVILNASRGEVFVGIRKLLKDSSVQIIGQDRVVSSAQAIQEFYAQVGTDETVFIGDGATDLWPEFAANPLWHLAVTPNSLAPTIATWASNQSSYNISPQIEAYYIRPSDAEIKKSK